MLCSRLITFVARFDKWFLEHILPSLWFHQLWRYYANHVTVWLRSQCRGLFCLLFLILVYDRFQPFVTCGTTITTNNKLSPPLIHILPSCIHLARYMQPVTIDIGRIIVTMLLYLFVSFSERRRIMYHEF